MSARNGALLVLVGSLLCGATCVASQGMTPGVYTDPTRQETIIVRDDRIAFHARTRDGRWFSREYDLYVGRDGYIQPNPMRSADWILGVGSYDWWWDGKSIIRENYKTGEKVEFSRISP